MNIKKVKFWLHHLDGLWSVPLAFLTFWLVGELFTYLFGFGTAVYDAAFFQPLFLSIAIVIGATNAAIWGLRFNFKQIYKYLYGEKHSQGNRVNYSKVDWKHLSNIQRIIISGFMFLFYVTMIIIVFLKLV
jgi:hypothetical protein